MSGEHQDVAGYVSLGQLLDRLSYEFMQYDSELQEADIMLHIFHGKNDEIGAPIGGEDLGCQRR